MPYVSLYRKYRSQTFDDVVGQDHVVRTIRNAIEAGRIVQDYLFCGSRGTGKTTVARLIAKALNCVNGPTGSPCNECESCESITNGSAVDVVEMDAASNRGVDDVDALREGVKYPPMRLRYKVYIIDEAHQLSPQAKDAFLKTLEEPPPHAVFILATTESQKIPITIRSRCQQFDFRRGTPVEIGDRLRMVCENEKAAIDDDALELIARAADGSYRDGLSLLEQVLAYSQDTVTAKDVYTVLGMVDEDVLIELGGVLASRDNAAAFALADRLMREGRDAREVLRSAARHFRDLLAVKLGAGGASREKLRPQAELLSVDRLVHIIDELCSAEKELRWNDQHRLGLELALLKAMSDPVEATAQAPAFAQVAREKPVAPASRPREASAESAPVQRPKQAATRPAAASATPTAGSGLDEPVEAAGEPGAPNGSPTVGDVRRNWEKILRHLRKVMRKSSEAALASEGEPVEVSDSVLTVAFRASHAFHQSRTKQNAALISEAIMAVMGADLRIVTVTVGETPASGQDVAGDEEAPEQHPLVDNIVMDFGGNVENSNDDYPWEDK